MIKSMTGFGSHIARHPQLGEASIEIRSVNNRFLDFNVRLPRELNAIEPRIREQVKQKLRRGKVDMYIRYVPAPDAQALYEINAPALRHYAQQAQAALHDLPQSPPLDISALLQLPGVVTPAPLAAQDGPLTDFIIQAVNEALNTVETSRETEGRQLINAIRTHLTQLTEIRTDIEKHKDELLHEYRSRLKEKVETLSKTLEATLDPARLETEIMFYADKSDITEELVRLDSHLKSFNKMINRDTGEPVGKSMDFLVQELLRETNTIGNKARGVEIASRIVQMKTEIEKIREQVQNLE